MHPNSAINFRLHQRLSRKGQMLFRAICVVAITQSLPNVAAGQDLNGSASLTVGGGGGFAAGPTSSRITAVPRTASDGEFLSCSGQAVSTYEDPTINMTVTLSGPTGQLNSQVGSGSGYLQFTVTGNATSSNSDEVYVCQLFAYNSYVSASATDSATLPPQPPAVSIADKQNLFHSFVGPGNYLEDELFGFKRADGSDYAVSAAISEVYQPTSNGCNITVLTSNSATNNFGEFGDRYGNPHLEDPGLPDQSFTCPTSSCQSSFVQTATFQGKRWSHTVTFMCSEAQWTSYSAAP